MWLKSSTKIILLSGAFLASSGFASEEPACNCKKIKKTDHVFSHNHFIMMDYSLDSFPDIGQDREPQTMFGSNLVYYTKSFSLFADILVGSSSAEARPILDGEEQDKEIKQLGLTIPFQIGSTKERIYLGKLALPTGLYEKQRLIPTVENGRTLTDSFTANYYTQYIPPVSEGVMFEIQKDNWLFNAGYFYPEELTLDYEINVGGLEPFIGFLPPNYKFDFFSGAGEILVDNQATGEFPDKISLPVGTQRKISYLSISYDNNTDSLIKLEYLRNVQLVYTEFDKQKETDPIRMYNKKVLEDPQNYYRIGFEKRVSQDYYITLERYLEKAKLYDGYNFIQRAGAYGISKAYDDHTLHFSYIRWEPSDIGSSEEFNVGVTYTIGYNLQSMVMLRKMQGSISQATIRSGVAPGDPVIDALAILNPDLFADNIIPFKESGFEFRLKYNF